MKRLVCEAVLFDLDGVLIDSTSCITRHWREWTRQHNLDMAALMKVAHGLRTVETMRIVAPHLNAEKEAERFTDVEVADTEGVVAIDGALRVVQGLPKDAWAIVTSANHELAKARLKQAGLPMPQTLVSGDDVGQGKPAPEPYLVAAQRLGKAPQQCVVVEDAPAGIEAALAAGMHVIGIAATHPREELDGTLIVTKLSDVHIFTDEENRLEIRID